MSPGLLQEAAQSYFIPQAQSGVVAVFAADESLQKANETMETKLEVEALVILQHPTPKMSD